MDGKWIEHGYVEEFPLMDISRSFPNSHSWMEIPILQPLNSMFPVFRGSWAFVGVAACLFGELILGPMILIRDDMHCIPKSSPLLWETAISVGWFAPYFGYGMDQLVALAYLRIVAYFIAIIW